MKERGCVIAISMICPQRGDTEYRLLHNEVNVLPPRTLLPETSTNTDNPLDLDLVHDHSHCQIGKQATNLKDPS